MSTDNNFNSVTFGIILLCIGVIGLIACGIISLIHVDLLNNGGLPAISFLIVILGIAFAFPSLLEDTSGGLSTMRIIVLIVVLVFAVTYIKLGWRASEFSEFFIDKSWIYILGLAFGSKAFQKFGESDSGDSGGSSGGAQSGGDGAKQ